MDFGASAGGDGGQGAQRTPLVLPSSVTRGLGRVICRQANPGTPEDTSILRVNGLPGQGQVWLVSVQGQGDPLAVPLGGVSDARRDTFAIIKWQVGNTCQQIEADLPAAGLSVPLLAETVEVIIRRAETVAGPLPDVFYAASMSSALGSPRAARLTRTIEAAAAAIGSPQRIPPKATEVQFSFNTFASQATATILIDFRDSAGTKVGATGFTNAAPGGVRYTLPQSAAIWVPAVPVGVAEPVVAVFEINP